MKKIKQIAATYEPGKRNHIIDTPLNDFIATLPQKGAEITNIAYIPDQSGDVCWAVVEYNE